MYLIINIPRKLTANEGGCKLLPNIAKNLGWIHPPPQTCVITHWLRKDNLGILDIFGNLKV
jgi:hypothetical protein